ncbi:Endoribonuclease L-PSP [Kribbella flavida DSM 17836]|uniref:Endoribonuclease L-PSP n=1 Tax=Kribbella flavida (strain DSM 17836 / JCM 10339 / NBRC 14399) TaxID=479435 RepID=D2PS29_KRIFD|nr:RidA family protein [Kribbella flavida]ADB31153.1 Endoribonuclease L-PSP [Kribbella flavida DSM 17836]
MANHFNPPGMWAPNGRAFNQGVVQPEGRVIHVTGQVAWDENSNVVGPGDAGAQLEKSLDNVRGILGQVGGTLADIVSMTVYFLNREDLPAIQQARSRALPAATAPASILIQVAGLVTPDLLVEVVPIAVVPLDRFRDPV